MEKKSRLHSRTYYYSVLTESPESVVDSVKAQFEADVKAEGLHIVQPGLAEVQPHLFNHELFAITVRAFVSELGATHVTA
jgi:hypothetical protein